jgi:hypothetical protein
MINGIDLDDPDQRFAAMLRVLRIAAPATGPDGS